MRRIHILVESYKPNSTAGLHGEVHIRPLPGQGYNEKLHVACSKTLSENYPVGTKFRIKINAELSQREGDGDYIYSHSAWKHEVVT